MVDAPEEFGDAVELPIDGTLDLHTFNPRDIGDLIPEWIAQCRARGLRSVRIVHGKGTGSLRRGVHAVLDRIDAVESYRTGGEGDGGWGATRVTLKP